MAAAGAWTSGCCGCCSDCGSCCCTIWCPCVVAGRIAEVSSRGMTKHGGACCLAFLLDLVGLSCLYTFGFRGQLRGAFGLPAEPCGDCCMHCFCQKLALCQEYRELKNRGFDPSQPFAVYAARYPGGAPMAPKMHR